MPNAPVSSDGIAISTLYGFLRADSIATVAYTCSDQRCRLCLVALCARIRSSKPSWAFSVTIGYLLSTYRLDAAAQIPRNLNLARRFVPCLLDFHPGRFLLALAPNDVDQEVDENPVFGLHIYRWHAYADLVRSELLQWHCEFKRSELDLFYAVGELQLGTPQHRLAQLHWNVARQLPFKLGKLLRLFQPTSLPAQHALFVLVNQSGLHGPSQQLTHGIVNWAAGILQCQLTGEFCERYPVAPLDPLALWLVYGGDLSGVELLQASRLYWRAASLLHDLY